MCRYGNGCLFAHNADELKAWKEEYENTIKRGQDGSSSDGETAQTGDEEIITGPDIEVSGWKDRSIKALVHGLQVWLYEVRGRRRRSAATSLKKVNLIDDWTDFLPGNRK